MCSSIANIRNLVNIQDVEGKKLPKKIDLLTYSFPCQDLSNVGAFHGYNLGIDRNSGSRSSLLWQVERILNERVASKKELPKFLLLENVLALRSERHRENFEEWKNILSKLGYHNHEYKLNAYDFGLPQNRDRIIMISTLCRDNDDKKNIEKYFAEHNLEDEDYRNTLGLNRKKLEECIRIDYKNKTYYEEAVECQPNDTKSRRKIWKDNYKIIDENNECKIDKVRTITTKQDRHPNSGNLYLEFDNGKGNFRYLTPRECFILMGFDEEDFDKIKDNNFVTRGEKSKVFTRDKLIKMAGNSIAVNVLMEVFKQIKDIEIEIFDNEMGINL